MLEIKQTWTPEEQEEIRFFWDIGFWNQLICFLVWQAIGTIVIIIW